MCQCGCIDVQPLGKIIGKDGCAYLIGIYASCRNCFAPAGVQIHKVPKSDWRMYDVKDVTDLEFFDGLRFIPVINVGSVRKAMESAMVGFKTESGAIDEIEANVLSSEAFPDLRTCVFETMAEEKVN